MTRLRRDKRKITPKIAIKNLTVKPTSCGRCFFCSYVKSSGVAYCTILDCLSYGNAGSLIADNDMIIEDINAAKLECPLTEVVGTELKN